MIEIAICICTRNRQEGLKKILDSLGKMLVPADSNIRIIIVENDLESRSTHIIQAFSSKCEFRISYFLETRHGIAFARNRSIREAYGSDFCCFVDDDQIVAPDWLVELVKCQREFDADGVWGPNPPIFNRRVSSCIRQFHMPKIYDYGAIVKEAYTNCLLLRKKYLDRINGPFDLRLNFTGGEDSYLTYLITHLGGIIRYNPNAIAYEIIPDSRTTLKFVIKRTFRISNTRLFINSLINTKKSKRSSISRLSMRFCYGLLIVIPFFIFGKAERLKGLIKIINAAGGFAFILGKQNQFYKYFN